LRGDSGGSVLQCMGNYSGLSVVMRTHRTLLIIVACGLLLALIIWGIVEKVTAPTEEEQAAQALIQTWTEVGSNISGFLRLFKK